MGSDVKRLADEEAARAEAEPDADENEEDDQGQEVDEPETPDDVPVTPLEPPQSPDVEAQRRAIVAELTRHEKAFAKALGLEPNELLACAVCDGSGFVAGGNELEQRQGLLDALRRANEWLAANDPAREYGEREDTEQCAKCHGLGMLRTGSRVPNQDVLPCPTCNGAGYTQHPAQTFPIPNGDTQAQAAPVDPTVAALRAQGYTVLEPMRVGQ
jgi:hypothetical protein